MKRSTIFIIIGAVIAVVALGTIVQSSNSGTSKDAMENMGMNEPSSSNANMQPAAPNTVLIRDFKFAPNKMTVKKGTKVTWTNQDEARHDVTPTSGADDFKASELMKQGESYSFTFNQVGTYEYKCSPHPYMKGTIEVVE